MKDKIIEILKSLLKYHGGTIADDDKLYETFVLINALYTQSDSPPQQPSEGKINEVWEKYSKSGFDDEGYMSEDEFILAIKELNR